MVYGLQAAEDAGLEAGSDEYKQAVIDAIKTMDGVKGITGTYSFDSDNNPKAVILYDGTVQNSSVAYRSQTYTYNKQVLEHI